MTNRYDYVPLNYSWLKDSRDYFSASYRSRQADRVCDALFVGSYDSEDCYFPPNFNQGIYLRPRKFVERLPNVAVENRNWSDKDTFRTKVDVHHFTPKEMTIRICNKEFVVIKCKHEEKIDNHGYVSREFTRRIRIPENCVVNSTTSTLSHDGILTIEIPINATSFNENDYACEVFKVADDVSSFDAKVDLEKSARTAAMFVDSAIMSRSV